MYPMRFHSGALRYEDAWPASSFNEHMTKV
jgi:hypothetical protein